MSLISIIIPTTRPENKSLSTFFNFIVPKGYDLEYFFIIDDPDKDITNLEEIIAENPEYEIIIIKNKQNLGTSGSRNIGLELSKGDYILSLDDDCIVKPDLIEKYIEVAEKYPNHPGFIGLTSAPEAQTSFEKGILLSDMLHFFQIAKHKEEFYWGITANLFLKREAIGKIRFPTDHPKKGGGEDIAFCLRILDQYNEKKSILQKESVNQKLDEEVKFKCVPEAQVIHPFWEEKFSNYLRFYRWGNGDVLLHSKFPQYKYHQFPNLVEFGFISVLIYFLTLGIILFSPNFNLNFIFFILLLSTLIMMFFWELTCESVKLSSRDLKFSLIPLIKAVLIRQLNDLGRFLQIFPRIWKISNRWDYFCTGESLDYEKKVAFAKFIGFLLCFFSFFSIYIFFFLLT